MSETMSSYVHKGSRDFEIEIDCNGLRQISPVITPLYDFSPSGTLTVHTDEIYQPLGKLIFIWKFIYIEFNHIGVNSDFVMSVLLFEVRIIGNVIQTWVFAQASGD